MYALRTHVRKNEYRRPNDPKRRKPSVYLARRDEFRTHNLPGATITVMYAQCTRPGFFTNMRAKKLVENWCQKRLHCAPCAPIVVGMVNVINTIAIGVRGTTPRAPITALPNTVNRKVISKMVNKVIIYDGAKVLTAARLRKIGELLGFNDSVKARGQGWGIKSVEVGHSLPATRQQAHAIATNYLAAIGTPGEVTGTPNIHFAPAKSAGKLTSHKPNYHPRNFAKRVPGYNLLCAEHGKIQGDKCIAACQWGMADAVTGKWAADSLAPVKGKKATGKATPRVVATRGNGPANKPAQAKKPEQGTKGANG